MSDGKKYYCFCGSNCKYETMTKEQILAAIAQATGFDNVDPDAGFITKVKEKNGGNYVTFWVGTQAQYNAIASKDTNCMYIITDDTTTADLLATINESKAAAETAAKAATESAAVSVAASTFIDISDGVSLTITKKPAGISDARVMTKEYRYNPASGVVFFSLYIDFVGAFAKGDILQFQQAGGYGHDNETSLACNCSCDGLYAEVHGSKDNHLISISSVEANGDGMLYVSGWYFCNGE